MNYAHASTHTHRKRECVKGTPELPSSKLNC